MRTPAGWSWPANLLVAQGPGSWPRGRRAGSEAEEILAEAVAWWDVQRSGFRDGDRWLRNLGQGGSALDLRLGLSLLANSNDPKWLGPEDTGYVYLPGVSGNWLSVPDSNALDVTGDLDVRILVAMDDWTPSAATYLLSKSDVSTQRSYELAVNTTGTLFLRWTTNGSTEVTATSTVAPTVADGAVLWVRATLAVNNGAGGYDVKFYTSGDGSSWAQLGSTVTGGATTSVWAGTSQLDIGRRGNSANYLSGRLYRVQVYNGIAGTLVLDVNCDAITAGSATSFTEQSANAATVTINRATSGRKSVAMPARRNGGRACMLLGTDDMLQCQDAQQHGLLNFGQGDNFSLLMAYRRWGTSGTTYLAKQATTQLTKGYVIEVGTSAVGWRFNVHDGTANNATGNVTVASGTLGVGTAIRNRSTLSANVNTTAATNGTQTNSGDLRNTQPFSIGTQSGFGNYGDFEFRCAAVWRRPLTSREITVLANSNLWGT